jgi:uncharacterized protein YraI
VARARHNDVLPRVLQRFRAVRKVAAAAAVTALAVAGGVAVALSEEPAESVSAVSIAAPEVRTSPVPVRVAPISRSEDRVRLEPKPPEVVGRMFATTAVNVRAFPSETSKRVGSLEWGEKVAVTGVSRGDWTEVVIDKESRWVATAYLADRKPRPEPEPEPESAEEAPATAPAPAGLSSAPCPSGSSVESGLTANAVAVHRAVCAAFPSITSYGGYRADGGEHGTGRALDIMVSGDAGWAVAEYVRANASELGVSEVLYSQRIWTGERSGEGWRSMEDRGSSTANHYDHVHVTVY